MKTLTDVKPLTKDQASIAAESEERVSLQRLLKRHCEAIASGAHEVIDRATTRGVSVETLQELYQYVQHTASCDLTQYPRTGKCDCGLSAALAEIEEKLRDA